MIKNKEKHTLSTNLGWNMDTTMSRFGEDWETDQSKVWDGSRSGDHNYTDNNYLKQNEITAQDGTLYDSATWTLNRVGDYDDFYLFRGTFDLGSMQLAAGKDYSTWLSGREPPIRKRMVCRHLKGLMEQLPHRTVSPDTVRLPMAGMQNQ